MGDKRSFVHFYDGQEDKWIELSIYSKEVAEIIKNTVLAAACDALAAGEANLAEDLLHIHNSMEEKIMKMEGIEG